MAKHKAEKLEFNEVVVISTRRGKMTQAVARALDRFDGATLEDKHFVLADMAMHAVQLLEQQDADPRAIPAPADASV